MHAEYYRPISWAFIDMMDAQISAIMSFNHSVMRIERVVWDIRKAMIWGS
jgi:hypothetical protein